MQIVCVRNLLQLNTIQIAVRNDTLALFCGCGVESHSYAALSRLDGILLIKGRYGMRHRNDKIKVQHYLHCYITHFLVPFFLTIRPQHNDCAHFIIFMRCTQGFAPKIGYVMDWALSASTPTQMILIISRARYQFSLIYFYKWPKFNLHDNCSSRCGWKFAGEMNRQANERGLVHCTISVSIEQLEQQMNPNETQIYYSRYTYYPIRLLWNDYFSHCCYWMAFF